MSNKKDLNNLIDIIVRDSHEYFNSWSELNHELLECEKEEISDLQYIINNHPMVNSVKLLKELSTIKKNMIDKNDSPTLFEYSGRKLLEDAGLIARK